MIDSVRIFERRLLSGKNVCELARDPLDNTFAVIIANFSCNLHCVCIHLIAHLLLIRDLFEKRIE